VEDSKFFKSEAKKAEKRLRTTKKALTAVQNQQQKTASGSLSHVDPNQDPTGGAADPQNPATGQQPSGADGNQAATDDPAQPRTAAKRYSAKEGKTEIKRLLRTDRFGDAADVLKNMEVRKGLFKGTYDRWKRRRATNKLVNQAYSRAKSRAKGGDIAGAKAAVKILRDVPKRTWIRNPEKRAAKMEKTVGKRALTMAHKALDSKGVTVAEDLIAYAAKLEGVKGTWKYKRARRRAKSHNMKMLELYAKQGSMDQFRAAARLLVKGIREDGKRLPRKLAKKIKQLHRKALRNSPMRDLWDAERLLKMEMPRVYDPEQALELAKVKLERAKEIFDRLEDKGIKVKTGWFKRGFMARHAKLEALFHKTKIQLEASNREPKRPGLFKATIERLYKHPMKRTQVGMATDSVWMKKKQAQMQEQQMAAELASMGLSAEAIPEIQKIQQQVESGAINEEQANQRFQQLFERYGTGIPVGADVEHVGGAHPEVGVHHMEGGVDHNAVRARQQQLAADHAQATTPRGVR
jgi:hypothetical protein